RPAQGGEVRGRQRPGLFRPAGGRGGVRRPPPPAADEAGRAGPPRRHARVPPAADRAGVQRLRRPPGGSGGEGTPVNTEEKERLRTRCLTRLRPFGVAEEDAVRGFDDLAAAYGEPGRYYHNLDHVRAVLHTIDELARLASEPAAVYLAAWFHDAVYDPRRGDNE